MQRSCRLKAGMLNMLLFLSIISFSQFRVVGYVPLGAVTPDVSKISFQYLTHLNIAFVNPDSTGTLIVPAGFDSLIQKAHNYNIKVLASIGGGRFNPYYASLLADTNRPAFIRQLINLSVDHHLDGIDVDLESDNIDKNYDPFIAGLAAALKATGKSLTAALATWNAQLITNVSLKKFDFVNIMSYDQTGPWRPNEPGPHSTYIKAEEDLKYWTKTRGLSKKKVNLGLPFYGYCFGTTYGEYMPYRTVVVTFPGSDQQDSVVPETGGIIHYNGLPTIQSKTALALKNAGGVMIWQLLQDAEGDKSLLTAINTEIRNARTKK